MITPNAGKINNSSVKCTIQRMMSVLYSFVKMNEYCQCNKIWVNYKWKCCCFPEFYVRVSPNGSDQVLSWEEVIFNRSNCHLRSSIHSKKDAQLHVPYMWSHSSCGVLFPSPSQQLIKLHAIPLPRYNTWGGSWLLPPSVPQRSFSAAPQQATAVRSGPSIRSDSKTTMMRQWRGGLRSILFRFRWANY